ncbi:MAG: DUF1800 domain-containing protein [Pyrinomonadaceae bacterium]
MSENSVSRFRVRVPRCVSVCVLLLATFAAASAAVPTILTAPTSTRAIAVDSLTRLPEPFPLTSPGQVASTPDRRTRVLLFVMNLDLLAGEGAKALTADAEDSAHRVFQLQVEAINDVPGFESIKAVVVRLHDEMNNNGDVLVRINLHGVSSNRARIAIGHVGGTIADDPGSTPSPAPAVLPSPTPTPGPPSYTGTASYADTVRLLEQATWGPTNSEIARVQGLGFRAFLNEQFNATLSSYPNLTFPPDDQMTGCPTGSPATCSRDNYSMYPLQVRFFRNALQLDAGIGQDQLRQRVAFALHQIIVISGRDINRPSWMTPYLQILDRNAFGNYRQLLQEITLNPAMGEYLDMRRSTAANPNENFPREILQLFSIGVDELNLDGTLRLSAQGERIPTYTQDTVNNFTRVFTGWTFAPIFAAGVSNYRDPMVPRAGNNHDTGSKTLLNGVVLPAGQNATQDLNAALDNIFNHPNVGPFIGQQLIQHLVTSNPSPAYVERVARAFNNDCDALYPDNCQNVRGDMKAVIRAILLDPEARGDVKTDPNYGKLREPVQFINNILRATNATSDGVIGNRSQRGDLPGSLDQPVFQPPTVFSYYSPLYEVPGQPGLLGPVFEILSTSTALRRANTVNTLIYSGIGTNADTPTGTQLNFSSLEALASNPTQLVDAVNALFLHNTMSAEVRSAITTAVNAIPTSDGQFARKRAQVAVYLVTTSPQFQIER